MGETVVRQRLAAVLAADAAEYSRLMSQDERATLALLDAARDVFRTRIHVHGGRVVDTAGDSVLALFETASGAAAAALEIQRELEAAALAQPAQRRLRFRIGLHLGDVLEKDDGTAYGDGVNIAARLQALAEPGDVLMSEAMRAALKGRLPAALHDLGERRLKNIAEPVRVFGLRPGARARRRSLRWLAAAAAVLLLAAGAWLLRQQWQVAAPERPAVAVLPFANLSGDPARDYYSDGITEDIIAALGRFPGLLVISHNAVRAYRGASPSTQDARSELKARYIVRGSLREAAGRLRATVELSDAEKGTLLWSERYEGEGAEVFAIQDRIVNSIVSSLQSRLAHIEQERAFAKPTESLEAYDLVLRARSLLDRETRRGNREARELLARALELAPEYPEILTATGEAEVQRALYGWIEDPPQTMKRAEALARRVLASADTRAHARAYVLLARIHSNLGEGAKALEAAERAIALNPSDARALFQRGSMLLYIGRLDEAIGALEAAMRFEPRPTLPWLNLAIAYYAAGRYGEALSLIDVLATRFPEDAYLHANRAATLAQLGRMEEARAASARVRALSPGFQVENFGTRFASPMHTAKLQEGLRKAGL